jgi:hypothetical protein
MRFGPFTIVQLMVWEKLRDFYGMKGIWEYVVYFHIFLLFSLWYVDNFINFEKYNEAIMHYCIRNRKFNVFIQYLKLPPSFKLKSLCNELILVYRWLLMSRMLI